MFKRFICLIAVASFILGGVAARAQDAGALLDLLVRNKIITRSGSGRSSHRADQAVCGDVGG